VDGSTKAILNDGAIKIMFSQSVLSLIQSSANTGNIPDKVLCRSHVDINC